MAKKKNRKRNTSSSTGAHNDDDAAFLKPEKNLPPRNSLVFVFAIVSMALLWLAFPPIGIWPLAWFAALPIIYLTLLDRLPGRRPYLQLQLAGLCYWLGTFYFIPIPHPALWAGWFVVSFYLSFYTPLTIGLSRVMIHRYRISPAIAVPMVWTGIEWFRCVLFSGMGMVCLSHSQYQQAVLIQIADLFGAYTLTFAIVMFTTCVAMIVWRIRSSEKHLIWRPSIVATGLVIFVFGYGVVRLGETPDSGDGTATIALIQGSIDTTFPKTEKEAMAIEERRVEQYRELTISAREKWNDLDLVIWPESSFKVYEKDPNTDITYSIFDVPPETRVDQLRPGTLRYIAGAIAKHWENCTGYPDQFDSPVKLLAGSTSYDPVDSRLYNATLLIGTDGMVAGRYFKQHLVMFGEYVPLADIIVPLSKAIPFFGKLAEIGRGLTQGTEFIVIDLNGVKLAPSICFETTVPHYVRGQVNDLAARDIEPDVLVNITNDGWFYGTSCLDFHLACNVFRAVEMRKPNLVCANTGLSGEIDAYGRILQQGPRRDMTVIKAVVSRHQSKSFYRIVGDLLPISFISIAFLLGILTIFGRRESGL